MAEEAQKSGTGCDESCIHRFMHIDTIKREGDPGTVGISGPKDWLKVYVFACKKCLEVRRIEKREPWRGKDRVPEWW